MNMRGVSSRNLSHNIFAVDGSCDIWALLVSKSQLHDRAASKVVVTVYYEALCPDSKYFLAKQLLPTFKIAKSIMEVKLAPYGKAKTKQYNGKITFDCQHGPTECQANIYHACAAEMIEDPLLRLEVATCMIMDNRLPEEAMYKCAKQFNFDVTIIQNCFESNRGVDLLKVIGEATHLLRPPVTFIPTITIDGSQGRQESILKDLFSEICKAAGDSEEVKDVCQN
ncbi:gamma-interferon-inducible lysosomal thiol reductase isoform X2 [Drosophila erecta]|uniref:gamma-interferon-inducible lysosomal thiol reductase isoform X2 n=1 Tax=Drosophila erecta TaxID=7220 RepID=UPI000F057E4E|nr:gamma-interferon-inducible lysosomal thiol reductase isoform X2 [Drosophila erecta]